MKNWFFVILIFLFCLSFSFGKNANQMTNSDLNEVKKMELKLFDYSFENDELSKRLERLELKVFNVVGTDSYKNRITSLKRALNCSNDHSTYTVVQPYYGFNTNPLQFNNNPYYRNNFYRQRYYPNRPRNNALKNLKSYFNGTMTGYTLPIQNSTYNNSSFYNPNNIYSGGGSSRNYSGNGLRYYNNTVNDGGITFKIID